MVHPSPFAGGRDISSQSGDAPSRPVSKPMVPKPPRTSRRTYQPAQGGPAPPFTPLSFAQPTFRRLPEARENTQIQPVVSSVSSSRPDIQFSSSVAPSPTLRRGITYDKALLGPNNVLLNPHNDTYSEDPIQRTSCYVPPSDRANALESAPVPVSQPRTLRRLDPYQENPQPVEDWIQTLTLANQSSDYPTSRRYREEAGTFTPPQAQNDNSPAEKDRYRGEVGTYTSPQGRNENPSKVRYRGEAGIYTPPQTQNSNSLASKGGYRGETGGWTPPQVENKNTPAYTRNNLLGKNYSHRQIHEPLLDFGHSNSFDGLPSTTHYSMDWDEQCRMAHNASAKIPSTKDRSRKRVPSNSSLINRPTLETPSEVEGTSSLKYFLPFPSMPIAPPLHPESRKYKQDRFSGSDFMESPISKLPPMKKNVVAPGARRDDILDPSLRNYHEALVTQSAGRKQKSVPKQSSVKQGTCDKSVGCDIDSEDDNWCKVEAPSSDAEIIEAESKEA